MSYHDTISRAIQTTNGAIIAEQHGCPNMARMMYELAAKDYESVGLTGSANTLRIAASQV